MKSWTITIRGLSGEGITLNYSAFTPCITKHIDPNLPYPPDEVLEKYISDQAHKMYEDLRYQIGWKDGTAEFCHPDGGDCVVRGVAFIHIKEV